MSKNEGSSDDSGCLWLVILIFLCAYACESRDEINNLKHRVKVLEKNY